MRFHARRAGAAFERHALETDPDTGEMQWSPKAPEGVRIRFTLTVTVERRHEIGEMSRDGGETWIEFLSMNLSRVDE